MADALMGGAFLSAFLQVLFDRMASREIVDFFQGRKLDNGLLHKLKITLLSVDAVLTDAEAKEISQPSVKKWLDELKDTVFDAEDLLDEIATEALRDRLDDAESQSCASLVCFSNLQSPFKKSLSSKIEEILARLEFIVQQKDALGLKEIGRIASYRVPTTCLVEETSVFGRDDDKETVIDELTDDICGDRMSVITIVGMGGVGKTTLAQLVYNDARVDECFESKVWIYVSEEYDVFRVTKTILEAVTSSTVDIKDLNLLQLELKEKLVDKKLLLVLDDVWNENCIEWEFLRGPFSSVAEGSKTIVTTRNERVASAVRSESTHHLKQLSDEDCWLLFSKRAFVNGNFSVHPNLEEIGRKITKKCNGLPLAAKALGCLLHSRLDAEEWNVVLKSNIWDLPYEGANILPALRLSYHYLPPPLKRCFAYCGMFPKNYQFTDLRLVQLWMAEDLLQPQNRNQTSEQVGLEYFQELKSRSFFHPSGHKGSYFVMHELVRDVACFVGGEFILTMGSKNSNNSMKRTRYLSFHRTRYDASIRFEACYEAKHLRTFLPSLIISSKGHFLGAKVLQDLLPKLRYLRVLSLSWYKNVAVLPDSIGNLKHLRFLNLSGTSIKRLPNSICNLQNLQSLLLYDCGYLRELPANIGRLINLLYLDIEKTKVRELPKQISMLKNLRDLTTYVVGKHDGLSIRDLKEFQHLRGRLAILEMQNIVNAQDALEANIKDKKDLVELSFNWSAETNDSELELLVLENLQPCTELMILSIRYFGGTRFPDWLGHCLFLDLVSLELRFCKYCLFLPPLGQLPVLEKLSIIGFDSIQRIGPEFYQNDSSRDRPFRSLKILKFENMLEWFEWISWDNEGGGGAFPCLEELCIRNCPKLAGSFPSHLPSLKKLVMIDCKKLVASNLSTQTFSELEIGNCEELVCSELPHTLKKLIIKGSVNYSSLRSFPLSLFPDLHLLDIEECDELQSFSISEGVQQDLVLTSLSYLRIKECPCFLSFPDGEMHLPNLKTLAISNCENLISLPKQMSGLLPSLHWLYIGNCPNLISLPEGGLPSKLTILTIKRCNKLIVNRMEWGLQRLHSLKEFVFGGEYENVEVFPEEGLLPTSLTSLSIGRLPNLIALNNKCLHSLTSLQELTIWNCPKLQSMPEEGIPMSLLYLKFLRCPLLKKRYRKGKGADWNQIAHVPCVDIDGELILS